MFFAFQEFYLTSFVIFYAYLILCLHRVFLMAFKSQLASADFLGDHTAHSVIGYYIMLSVYLSVLLYFVAKRYFYNKSI